METNDEIKTKTDIFTCLRCWCWKLFLNRDLKILHQWLLIFLIFMNKFHSSNQNNVFVKHIKYSVKTEESLYSFFIISACRSVTLNRFTNVTDIFSPWHVILKTDIAWCIICWTYVNLSSIVSFSKYLWQGIYAIKLKLTCFISWPLLFDALLFRYLSLSL